MKTDSAEIKIALKKNGTDLNKGQPYIKTEMVFSECYSMDQIINAVISSHTDLHPQIDFQAKPQTKMG